MTEDTKKPANKSFLSDTSSDCDNEIFFENSDFIIFPVDSIDQGDASITPPPKVSLQLPASKTVDLFLFHVHEEGEKLYLFGKHRVGENFYTICIEVSNPYYYLQFLPIAGHEFDIAEEVCNIAHKCKGSLVHKEMKEMRYSFDNSLIPKRANYLCATFSSDSILSRIRPNGIHYSHVFGVTATLSENLFVRRKIFCPSWIRATNCTKKSRYTTVPMLSVPDIDSISPISVIGTPPMNLCTISIRSMFKTNEIFMISTRIFCEWDLDEFTGKGTKTTTYVCSSSGGAVSPDVKPNQNLRIFRTEKELLAAFAKLIDDYDIDIMVSYGLIPNDIPLLFNRLKVKKVDDWWRIGRIRRSTSIKNGKINPTYALSGRIPCDIQISFSDFIKAKSNDLSAAVHAQFGFERQQIDHYEVVGEVKNAEKLYNLVNYNVRDTLFIAQLVNAREILPLGLQIAQLSGCQWSRVLLSHASFLCEAMLIRAYYDHGFVLPDKCITNQPKYPSFPGGLVLQPKRGFYENCVVALDYYSLYPSIIIEYNICFTTVNLKNPNAEESKNSKIKGILPEVMADLLNEREKVKVKMEKLIEGLKKIEGKIEKLQKQKSRIYLEPRSDGTLKTNHKNGHKADFKNALNLDEKADIGKIFTKNKNFVRKGSQFAQSPCSQNASQIEDFEKKKFEMELELQRLNTKQTAIKVLANAMYGYLGYRHSRFLANALAALVASKGREILQRTVEIVEKNGKDSIIYGDTDSVMIDSGTKDPIEALAKGKEIAETVSSQFTHLKFGVEGVFLKLLLVQKKRYVALVYDEPGKSHQLTKGIELVRRDWCGLTKYVSAYILEQFLYSDDKDTATSNILSELSRISEMLRNNGVPPTESEKNNPNDQSSSSLSCSASNIVFTGSAAFSNDSYTSTYTTSVSANSTNNTSNCLVNSTRDTQVQNGSDFHGPLILPTVSFPQMYGACNRRYPTQLPRSQFQTQRSQFQTQAQRQKQQELKVKLKDLRAGTRSTLSILREYGISSKFAPSNENDQNKLLERVTPLEYITIEHLIIHMTLTKAISKYQDKMAPHVMVAMRMEERGEHVLPNTTIKYIISNFASREIGEKARIPDEISEVSDCDAEWYLSNQIMAPIWRLCEPFGGMDAAMIARALGLVIPQTFGLPERDECVQVVIPHTSELMYNCIKCGESIIIDNRMKTNLKCMKCGEFHNWKYVSNILTNFVRNFIMKANSAKCDGNLCDFQTIQIPINNEISLHENCSGTLKQVYSCVSIFNTLKYFRSLFERSNIAEDDKFSEFRDYMRLVMDNFLDAHGFMRIQLNSIFSSLSNSSSSRTSTGSASSNSMKTDESPRRK
ncbi:hypothetical protein TRFO_41265 [Tritrichomonas foetus]|uniref:DNA polymerase n=1 Tax=Tritrichomonas foetus TaxID=1144522 RepID=A0A1J4L180_9EUKA|nr:hypothetical protein TRFO_41265 [Tritrichomonas foetus]|eukprot:OHT17170.1 hypothetical protein TRFO_41265 [Tritrichomonas foetus]